MTLWFPLAVVLAAPLAQQPPAPPLELGTVFGTTVVIPSGLKGEIYHLPPGTDTLAVLGRLTPVGVIYTTNLNVPPQDFLLGFPGVTDRFEWFAIDYTGKFWIERPGIYRFRLLSDDGAMLYIDGQLIADNDGTHAAESRRGSVWLERGAHNIRVPYYQGPRETVALRLEVAGPGEEMPRVFSTDEFKPPPNPEQWDQAVATSAVRIADADLPRHVPERIAAPRTPGRDNRRGRRRK
jgi:hypothetical protein